VRLGLGTDTGGVSGGNFGLGSHVELELLVTKAGLTPMQAVVLGTHTAAEISGPMNSAWWGRERAPISWCSTPIRSTISPTRAGSTGLSPRAKFRARRCRPWQAKNAQLAK
jgi:hypothetical protein